jgi:hypothetical protein
MALARARMVLVCSFVLGAVCLIAAGSAEAQVKRSLSGTNLRFQIGGELEIPIAATRQVHTAFSMSGTAKVAASCLPKGGIKGINPTPMAEVTTWPTGRARILTSRFTLRGPLSNRSGGGKYKAKVIGVKTQNPVALQVVTYFQIQIPKPSMTMTPTRGIYVHPTTGMGMSLAPAKARKNGGMSGRTGPDIVSFCAGSTATVTMGGNPGCANPLGGGAPVKIHSCYSSPNPCPGPGYMYKVVKGYMRYARTGRMLGGPANGKLKGPANVVLGATGGGAFVIPLNIGSGTKIMTVADPAIGGSFGQFFQQNAGKGPQFLTVMNNPCGIVSKLGPKGVTKAAENRTSASFGGPQTQGTLTVAAATQTGVEKYVLKGYDHRGPKWAPTKAGNKATPISKATQPAYKAGQGRLQLVVGSISLRSFTGSNANQGVLKFKIPEPATAAGAAAALLVLVICHRAMNRRR